MAANPGQAVHIVRHKGRLLWSGPDAGGDPARREGYFLRVDVAGEHRLEGDSTLVVPRVSAEGFTPEGLALAARAGWFGFRIV